LSLQNESGQETSGDVSDLERKSKNANSLYPGGPFEGGGTLEQELQTAEETDQEGLRFS
jgi:hypothetical protein